MGDAYNEIRLCVYMHACSRDAKVIQDSQGHPVFTFFPVVVERSSACQVNCHQVRGEREGWGDEEDEDEKWGIKGA